MKELLSNEEIDTLLELFRAESGAVPVEPEPEFVPVETERSAVSTIDLLKPNRFGRDRLQSLERLFSTAAKSIATLVAERLRIDVTFECVGVEQLRFASWRRQLDGPVGIWTFSAKPFESPVLLTLTAGCVRGIVDRLLGGSGAVANSTEQFTSAELAVAEALVEPLFERLAGVLRDVVEIEPRIEGRSGSPSTVPAMATSDVVLSVYFQIGGDILHGDVRLAIAYHDLEPFLDRLGDGGPLTPGAAPTGVHADTVATALRDMPLGVSVVLGGAELSLGALLGLRVADVVRLDRVAGELFDARVEGECKLRGSIERRGNVRTFRVVERVAPIRIDESATKESRDDDV